MGAAYTQPFVLNSQSVLPLLAEWIAESTGLLLRWLSRAGSIGDPAATTVINIAAMSDRIGLSIVFIPSTVNIGNVSNPHPI